jgi:hypothetical protein
MYKSTPIDDYNQMKQAEKFNYYKRVADYSESLGNRGRPPGLAVTEMMTGQSINPPTIQLTRDEIEERERARHLQEYNKIRAEYERRQEAEAAAKAEEAAAAKAKAEAAAAAPKSPKSPKSPSKGSKGGSKRNRRNNRNRTYRGRPTRSRSSRRNA